MNQARKSFDSERLKAPFCEAKAQSIRRLGNRSIRRLGNRFVGSFVGCFVGASVGSEIGFGAQKSFDLERRKAPFCEAKSSSEGSESAVESLERAIESPVDLLVWSEIGLTLSRALCMMHGCG